MEQDPSTAPQPVCRQEPEGKRSGMAVASLILGIAGLCVLPVIGAILAVVFGSLAKREIRIGSGAVGGSGMATAGLTLGIIGLTLPIIASWVLVGWGFIFWRSGTAARDDLVGAVETARLYYFQNDNSYHGMDADTLTSLEESIDVRMAPGRLADVVYLEEVTDQTARLYCYSSAGRKYIAAARGSAWRYNFNIESGEGLERFFRHLEQGEPSG